MQPNAVMPPEYDSGGVPFPYWWSLTYLATLVEIGQEITDPYWPGGH